MKFAVVALLGLAFIALSHAHPTPHAAVNKLVGSLSTRAQRAVQRPTTLPRAKRNDWNYDGNQYLGDHHHYEHDNHGQYHHEHDNHGQYHHEYDNHGQYHHDNLGEYHHEHDNHGEYHHEEHYNYDNDHF